MNIEKLKKIRNKSVSQQNALTYFEMQQCSSKAESIAWLIPLLSRYGLSIDNGILVSLSNIFEQYGMLWYGTWLTKTKIFYEFEVMTDRESVNIIEVESWEEVRPEISAHKRGIGKTPAYIALELLLAKKS